MSKAIELLRECNLSRIIVAQGSLPLSAAEIKGTIDEEHLQAKAFEEDVLTMKCSEVMGPRMSFVGSGESVGSVLIKLEQERTLLVMDIGRPSLVVSASDGMSYLENLER